MRKLAHFLGAVSTFFGFFLLLKYRAPIGWRLWPLKLVAGAVSPILAVGALVATVLGLLTRAPAAVVMGLAGATVFARYVWRVVSIRDGFDRTFGENWGERIPPEIEKRMLPARWTWAFPPIPEPRWERHLPFWQIPGKERPLLCDLWLPPSEVPASGLGFIYLHGSAWYLTDKDAGTRTFFSHLAAQGHMVMDVAYRLAPETDMAGMVGDAKRAVAWLKTNGARYGVNPERVVLGGGSAGAHLALLAAYTPQLAALTPSDVEGQDLAVRAVVSYYGPTDMLSNYFFTRQDERTRGLALPLRSELERKLEPAPGDSVWRREYIRLGLYKNRWLGSFAYLLGGHPDEVPEKYSLFSPITYVRPTCPPTMLIEGKDDFLVPWTGTRALYEKLVAAGVPSVLIGFPETDHAFDLLLPRLSPPAQTSYYEIDRFLALMA